MDNLTHSLTGLMIGEAASQNQKEARTLLLTASVLANNFPDLDLVYTNILPPPLGYLIHHRGHTHTLGGILLEFFMVLMVLALWPRFRMQMKEKGILKLTAAVVAVGLCTHILMDGFNSYGIHPFWPLSSKWFFGDFIFIVEPMLWVCFSVPLFFTFKSKAFKSILAGLVYGVSGWAWWNNYLTWYSALALVAVTILLILFRKKPVFSGFAIAAVFLVIQLSSSLILRHRIQGSSLDVVMNSMPSNPICWNVIQMDVDISQNSFLAQMRPVSLLPNLVPTESCPQALSEVGEATFHLAQFREYFERDCRFAAWLSFARAPMFEGNQAFDLRFSLTATDNFSTLRNIGEGNQCDPISVSWDRPRQDLIEIVRTGPTPH